MKKLDLKNHKVLLGLFSLLFITSIAQTAAILENKGDVETGNQTAQVLTTASCVSVSHNYNQIFTNPFTIVQGLVPDPMDYDYKINVRITNSCPRPVSIIDSGSLNTVSKDDISSVSYMGIEYLGSNGPEAVVLDNNIYGIDPIYEDGICVDCGGGSMQYRFSPLGTDYSQGAGALRTFSVAVGQTREFAFTLAIGVPHSADDVRWLRAKLLKLKWFYNNAYLDNVVTSDEVRTTNLTSAQQQSFATDYAILTQDGNAPNTMCPAGTNPVFSDTAEPDCE